VAWIARQQLALVATRQLLAAGLNRESIRSRCKSRVLHRIHQGVYLRGQPPLLPGARELASVLALGAGAVVSHRSAVALLGLGEPVDGPVDVTIVGRRRRHRRGIRVHCVPHLDAADHGDFNGIPITSPARALLDFATQAERDELERAIGEAYALKLTTERELRRTLDRNPHRGGVAGLRAELDREGGPAWTRSEAERRMKRLVRKARLPVPLTNQCIAGFDADFLWPECKLIVEVDGYQFHGHRQAFERDRKRDAAHTLAGYTVIRITWIQLTEDPMAVAVTIARALEVARWRGRHPG
jgi:very-short-patch-repair endonuclease